MIVARKVEDGFQSVTGTEDSPVPDSVLRPVVEAGKSYHFRLLLKLATDYPDHGIGVDFSGSTCSITGQFAGQDGAFWMQIWGPAAAESAPYNVVALDPLEGSLALAGGGVIEFMDSTPKYVVIEGFIRPTVGGELRPAYSRPSSPSSEEPVHIGVGSSLTVEECS